MPPARLRTPPFLLGLAPGGAGAGGLRSSRAGARRCPRPPPARLRPPSFRLGFALGGFFDGILLHQILQWHHLLSLWTRPDDFAFQSTWDGLFHAAHYAIAAGALYVLWR